MSNLVKDDRKYLSLIPDSQKEKSFFHLCKEVSRKGAPRKILGCFKEVSRVFQESFKGSRKTERCFNEFLSGFKRCSKEFQLVFEESF